MRRIFDFFDMRDSNVRGRTRRASGVTGIHNPFGGCAWVVFGATFCCDLQPSEAQLSDAIQSVLEATLSSWRRSFSPGGSKLALLPDGCFRALGASRGH